MTLVLQVFDENQTKIFKNFSCQTCPQPNKEFSTYTIFVRFKENNTLEQIIIKDSSVTHDQSYDGTISNQSDIELELINKKLFILSN